jgi:hypothetical protein
MTTAFKVKRKLVDTIARHPAFATRQVTFGHPGSELESECVFVNTVGETERARSLGKAHRREELTVEVAIISEQPGSDAEDTCQRAYQMLAGVEEAIADDSSLGGLALIAEVTGFSEQSWRGEQREVTEISVQVRVLADKDLT